MGISIPQLLIILAILVLLFGTKRLRNIGGDLGSAVKGFRKAMGGSGEETADKKESAPEKLEGQDAQFDSRAAADSEKDKQQP